MKIIYHVIALLGIVLIAAGAYLYTRTGASSEQVIKPNQHEAMPTLGAYEAGTRVVIKNTVLSPGNQTLSFELYGKDGHAFGEGDLKVAHTKKMHLIIVSDDFSSYQHVHPAYAKGLWGVDITLANNTAYNAYFDVEPLEESPQVLRVPLSVGTPAGAGKISQSNTTITVGGVIASLKASTAAIAGHDTAIAFSLTEAGVGLVAEPYLGAEGHVVAIDHKNPDNFAHVHPVSHASVAGDNDVHFNLNVPLPGTYTLFAQFKTGGTVRAFPFTVIVTGDDDHAAAENDSASEAGAHIPEAAH